MSVELVSEKPPGGMSTRKKWLIGCGGCLGLIIVITVVLVIALSMGWNALQKASGDSVKNIFGPTYQASGYVAMGLPLNQPKMKNLAMLIPTDQSSVVFAFDTEASAAEMNVLRQGTQEQLQAYFKKLNEQFLKNDAAKANSSRLQDLQFSNAHYVSISGNKRYLVVHTFVQTASDKNQVTFMPGSVALLLQAENRMVALIAMAPKAAAEEILPGFKDRQTELDAELGRLIQDSELDDRLLPVAKK
jgi:hypothetical protein